MVDEERRGRVEATRAVAPLPRFGDVYGREWRPGVDRGLRLTPASIVIPDADDEERWLRLDRPGSTSPASCLWFPEPNHFFRFPKLL